jgi:hypothetical protein
LISPVSPIKSTFLPGLQLQAFTRTANGFFVCLLLFVKLSRARTWSPAAHGGGAAGFDSQVSEQEAHLIGFEAGDGLAAQPDLEGTQKG